MASTWNYQAVHAKGILKFLDDQGLHQLLIKLIDHFESDPHFPASVHEMNEIYLNKMMKAILAFEIEVTHIDHVFKLSQNHNQKTVGNIVNQLESGDLHAKAVAKEMKK